MNNVDLTILIPILISLGLFAMIFGIVYLRNRERMAMIERGFELQGTPPKKHDNSFFTLTMGLLLIGCGLGLFIASMIDYFALQDRGNPAIYFSLISVFGGLGLFTSYLIERKNEQKKDL